MTGSLCQTANEQRQSNNQGKEGMNFYQEGEEPRSQGTANASQIHDVSLEQDIVNKSLAVAGSYILKDSNGQEAPQEQLTREKTPDDLV